MEKEELLKLLKDVVDPELGINVVDLGLIYEIEERGEKIFVRMTLTSPMCPLGAFIVEEVERKLKEATGKDVEIEITFDPPWSPDRMSAEAKKKLGIES